VTRRSPFLRAVAALALSGALLAVPAAAQDQAEESVAYEGLLGAGATLSSLVYCPLKLAYAVGGTVVSGLAWAWTLGDTGVSGPIFHSAVGGDYVVTPSHIDGRRQLHFIGRPY